MKRLRNKKLRKKQNNSKFNTVRKEELCYTLSNLQISIQSWMFYLSSDKFNTYKTLSDSYTKEFQLHDMEKKFFCRDLN